MNCINVNILVWHTIILQNVTIGKNWAKGARDLPILFLKMTSECTIIPKVSITKKNIKVCGGRELPLSECIVYSKICEHKQ